MTVRDAPYCAVSASISAGGGCAHFFSKDEIFLTRKEILDLIDAHQDRECVPVVDLRDKDGKVLHYMNVCAEDQDHGDKVKLPGRGPGVIMSGEDFGEKKEELEIACRFLGKRCVVVRPQAK